MDETNEDLQWIMRSRAGSFIDDREQVLSAVTIEMNLDTAEIEFVWDNAILPRIGVISGILVFIFILLQMMDECCTRRKFDNYIASELYSVDSDKIKQEMSSQKSRAENGDSGDEQEVKDIMTDKKSSARGYYNEILSKNNKMLNKGKVSLCGSICCGSRKVEKVFSSARICTNQELNITSIVKAQRESNFLIKREKLSDEALAKIFNKYISLSGGVDIDESFDA